jgi:hypothetical protein
MNEFSTSVGRHPKRVVVLYTRPGCHLCDEARVCILQAAERIDFRFEEISVEGSPALERAYGIRVPVVVVDGQEEFEFEVDPARLERLLV